MFFLRLFIRTIRVRSSPLRCVILTKAQTSICAAILSALNLLLVEPAAAQVAFGGGPPANGGSAPTSATPPFGPPPVGVGGASMPIPGRTVLFYSDRWISLGGLQFGTRNVTPEMVVLSNRNPYAPPIQYRRVPISANIYAQSFGISHGVNEWLSLVVVGSYLNKDSTSITFKGPSGTTRLGTSRETTEGFGDTLVGSLIRLWSTTDQQVIAGMALSLPTGSLTERIMPLQPTGLIGNMRGGYALQNGTGTFDFVPTLSYTAKDEALGYGVAYRGRFAMQDRNDEGYRWGNLNVATAWMSWDFNPNLSGSLRVEASNQGAIHGHDPQMMAAAVGYDPRNIGGTAVDVFTGFNVRGPLPGIGRGFVGAEFGLPVYENVNGIHLARKWSVQLTTGVNF